MRLQEGTRGSASRGELWLQPRPHVAGKAQDEQSFQVFTN